jgi:transposase
MDGIVYRYRAGIPWRDLPEVFGPWQTVWKRHRRFSGDGTWNSILARLLSEADAVGKIVWEVSVDFDGDSGASTRDESSAHHGGNSRITRIYWKSLLITLLAAPAVV